mmetsp:Transcript_100289/g.198904  ORF Transcript_100289/g.198904 Transcript_100289/m.198904 type:complete len:190 (-) Transcript_100289:282-851(-)
MQGSQSPFAVAKARLGAKLRASRASAPGQVPEEQPSGGEPSSSGGSEQRGGGREQQEARGREAVGKKVLGAQKLLGNLTGFIRETQSAVAESLSGLGQGNEDGGGRPRRAERFAQNHQNLPTSPTGSAAAKRLEIARNDAAQYFVEYKCLDLSLLPAELIHTPGGTTPGPAWAAAGQNAGHVGHRGGTI